MRRRKVFFMALFLAFFVASMSSASGVKLTADNMYFDTKTGLLEGKGNVVLRKLELKVTSDRCEGDYKENTARMWSNVRGMGNWNGQKMDFFCKEFKADFKDPSTFTMRGTVSGSFGSRVLECGEVVMVGEEFLAEKVSKFQDKNEGLTLSCSKVKGLLKGDSVREFIASGNVDLRVKKGSKGTLTKIKGAKAVYSKDRGTIVVSGNAVALQRGRKVTAKSIVFYPATSKIEAKGKPQITFEVE